MNFITIFGLITQVLGKGIMVLKNPKILAKLTETVIGVVVLVQALHDEKSGEDKQKLALDTINNLFDCSDMLVFDFSPETETFVKTQFIPNAIQLIVSVFNSLGVFKKKETLVPVV